MGFRFRKSVKIAPGVRLNVGKRSASVTIGGKRGRLNIGSRGTSVGTSIPGTGISYNKRIISNKKNSKNNKTTQVDIQREKQNSIEQAKIAIKDYEAHIDAITNIHSTNIEVFNWNEISQSSPPFNLGEDGPNVKNQRTKVANYKPTIRDRIFNRVEARKRILEQEIEKARIEDEIIYQEWIKNKRKSDLILEGDRKVWLEAVSELHSFDRIPGIDPRVEISILEDKPKAYVNVNIKNHDVVPTTSLSITQTGKLSEKKLTKTDYYQLYREYICSCIFRIGRELFALIPIDEVTININDVSPADESTELGCILSINLLRDKIKQIDFKNANPSELIEHFEHNIKFLKTKGFRHIEELK